MAQSEQQICLISFDILANPPTTSGSYGRLAARQNTGGHQISVLAAIHK